MDIKVSPKYGLNPTLPVCFWCGQERGDIALLGHIGDGRKHEDIEAPRHAIIDFEPCGECKEHMALGFTLMEATSKPNQYSSMPYRNGVYPTGRYAVVNPKAIQRIFGDVSAKQGGKAFLDSQVFQEMFMNGGGMNV